MKQAPPMYGQWDVLSIYWSSLACAGSFTCLHPFIPHKSQKGSSYPHFPDEETEAQEG